MKKILIRQVEAFRAVVTLGSMSKAAELLGISQPAVSRLMADFQEAVGFRLFKRKRNTIEPTPDARALFTQVEKLFYGLEELGDQIAAIKNMNTGRVVIAATSSFATGLLPDVISDFREIHRSIAFSLYIHPHDQILDWVASGRADIGFTTQPVATTELSTADLASRAACCIFPVGHPLATKELLHPADLVDHPFVSFPRGAPLRFQIDGIFDRLGLERLLEVEATSHHAVCALVSAGLGVAIVNPFSPIMGHRALLTSRPIEPSLTIELKMLWRDSNLSISSTRFRDFARTQVARRAAAQLDRPARKPARMLRLLNVREP